LRFEASRRQIKGASVSGIFGFYGNGIDLEATVEEQWRPVGGWMWFGEAAWQTERAAGNSLKELRAQDLIRLYRISQD